MQRSISNKNSLAPFIYVLLFIVYESLSSIYLFLPPLFAVLFVLFVNALKRENSLHIFLIFFCLVFESQEARYNKITSIATTTKDYVMYRDKDKVVGTSLIFDNANKKIKSKNVVANYQIKER